MFDSGLPHVFFYFDFIHSLMSVLCSALLSILVNKNMSQYCIYFSVVRFLLFDNHNNIEEMGEKANTSKYR